MRNSKGRLLAKMYRYIYKYHIDAFSALKLCSFSYTRR